MLSKLMDVRAHFVTCQRDTPFALHPLPRRSSNPFKVGRPFIVSGRVGCQCSDGREPPAQLVVRNPLQLVQTLAGLG